MEVSIFSNFLGTVSSSKFWHQLVTMKFHEWGDRCMKRGEIYLIENFLVFFSLYINMTNSAIILAVRKELSIRVQSWSSTCVCRGWWNKKIERSINSKTKGMTEHKIICMQMSVHVLLGQDLSHFTFELTLGLLVTMLSTTTPCCLLTASS